MRTGVAGVLRFSFFDLISACSKQSRLESCSAHRVSHCSSSPSVQAAGSEEGEVAGRGAITAGKGEL